MTTCRCNKCGKEINIDRMYPKGWCEKCYKETTIALAEIVEKENQWQGRLYDKKGEPI